MKCLILAFSIFSAYSDAFRASNYRFSRVRCPQSCLRQTTVSVTDMDAITESEQLFEIGLKNEINIADFNSLIRFKRVGNNMIQNSSETVLYLPGIDGIGSYSQDSLRILSQDYNVWSMVVDPDDRSTFFQITDLILKFILSLGTPVILIGESVGALMASYISIRSPTSLSKMVFINPATSFERTIWPSFANIIPASKSLFTPLFTSVVIATAADVGTLTKVAQSIVRSINTTDDIVREVSSLVAYSKFLTNPSTLHWRLTQWLDKGNFVMKNKLKNIAVQTLIIVGDEDGLLPSVREAMRLEDEMTGTITDVIEIKKGRHALLAGGLDLSSMMKKSKIFKAPAPKKPIDYTYPSEEKIRYHDTQLAGLRTTTSPIYLRRLPDGTLERGLGDLPVGSEGRPVLYVSNHQLFGRSWNSHRLIVQIVRVADINLIYPLHPINNLINFSSFYSLIHGVKKKDLICLCLEGNS